MVDPPDALRAIFSNDDWIVAIMVVSNVIYRTEAGNAYLIQHERSMTEGDVLVTEINDELGHDLCLSTAA
jgi:hypothetical protein